MSSILYRALPSIDVLFKGLFATGFLAPENEGVLLFRGEPVARALVREELNGYLDFLRQEIREGRLADPDRLSGEAVLAGAMERLGRNCGPHLRRVVNATGVVIHTNLGRAVLAPSALKAVQEVAAGYSNLEFDLESGERGSRYSHVEKAIRRLTGAEAAVAVNNNAAAVLLLLDTLCRGREVVVSRGQLVEIGGSFRIPDVMLKSGCVLREVGTTNRVHERDYAGAVNENTAAIMLVHTSNYRVIGFHKQLPLPDLVRVGRERGVPVLVDLGSGNFCDFAAAGQPRLAGPDSGEPRVQKIVADGADVVTFSGDKLLGGPQAGIIAGKAEFVARIKANPLTRALRLDKMTLAALEATLRLYLEPELALREVPTLRMIRAPLEELRRAASSLARVLRRELRGLAEVAVRRGESPIGGGAFPEQYLPTALVTLKTALPPQALRQALLRVSPPLTPVVARVEDDQLCLDVRCMERAEYAAAARSLKEVLGVE